MSATTPVATFAQSNFTTQDPATYKSTLDGNNIVAQRIIDQFAPHQAASPNMTVVLDAGCIFFGGALTEVAQQTSGTITAPSGSNKRIDRAVIDATTGTLSIITGTPTTGTPTIPALTAGKLPVAQIGTVASPLLSTTTTITNSMLVDERCFWAAGTGRLINIQKLTTGTTTYTPTAGMQTCVIKLQGDSGASGSTTGVGGQSASSGAGGAGDYMELLATAANIGTSAVVAIGAGGVHGASGNNPGGNGAGTSITINGSTWTAGGGLGGAGQASSASAQISAAPGAGGTATSGSNATLIVDIPGQAGSYGQANGAVGGAVSSWSGKGGDSVLGKGGPQGIGASVAGTGYGSAPSGYYNASGSNQAGINGQPGVIIIEEYS